MKPKTKKTLLAAVTLAAGIVTVVSISKNKQPVLPPKKEVKDIPNRLSNTFSIVDAPITTDNINQLLIKNI